MSFLSDAETVIKVLNDYYIESASGKRQVIDQSPLEDIINELNLASYVKKGGLSEDHLLKFIEKYLSLTTRLHHPSYLAHQVAVPHYAGAIGSLIDVFRVAYFHDKDDEPILDESKNISKMTKWLTCHWCGRRKKTKF